MAWISKGLSDQSIKSTVTSGNGFDPRLDDSLNNFKLLLEFNGSNKITNLYITFEIKSWFLMLTMTLCHEIGFQLFFLS